MSSHLASLLAEADDSGGGGSAFLSLLPLIVIFGALYFVLIRPQRRRLREQQAAQERLQKSLEIGSEIVTAAGIYGTVTGEDGDDVIWVEIDDDVQIRLARAAVQTVLNPADDSEDEDDADIDAESAASD